MNNCIYHSCPKAYKSAALWRAIEGSGWKVSNTYGSPTQENQVKSKAILGAVIQVMLIYTSSC